MSIFSQGASAIKGVKENENKNKTVKKSTLQTQTAEKRKIK